MRKLLILFFAASMLACADTPLITGYFAVSGYWKVQFQSMGGGITWETLTNTQWTTMTDYQWTGTVN